jgi:hypothetical protein
LEGWEGPEKASTYHKSTAGTGATGSAGAGKSQVKTTKKIDPVDKTIELPAKVDNSRTGEDDDVVEVDGEVVEVPIGEDHDTRRAMHRVSALGLATVYQDSKELADAIGIDKTQLANMRGVELANRLSVLHFGIGYAVGQLESKATVAEIRRKAADKSLTMEFISDKHRRAQSHIWEHRRLVVILAAIHKGGYEMNIANVKIALAAFPRLGNESHAGILKAAETLLEGKESVKMVDDLIVEFQNADADESKSKAS